MTLTLKVPNKETTQCNIFEVLSQCLGGNRTKHVIWFMFGAFQKQNRTQILNSSTFWFPQKGGKREQFYPCANYYMNLNGKKIYEINEKCSKYMFITLHQHKYVSTIVIENTYSWDSRVLNQ